MRISPGVLLFLLSTSFVAGIAIIDVPTHETKLLTTTLEELPSSYEILNDYAATDEADDADDITLQMDADDDSEVEPLSNRRLLGLRKAIKRIFHRPKPAPKPAPAPKAAPKPVPAPAPKAAPKPAPKAAPKPAPKAAPKPAPAPAPKPAPKPVPAPKAAPKPAPKPASKPASPPAPKKVVRRRAPFKKVVHRSVVPKKLPVVLPVAAVIKTVTAPKATPTPTPATQVPIFFTCDNEFDMFVNGVKVGKGDTWTTTYKFSPMIKPGDVIAIDGVDKGGPAAFIGVFGGKPTKASDWRCSTTHHNGWNLNHFDDSSWSKAISYGRNQDNNIWRSVGRGSRPNIPADAEWLWTSNNENHNRVYCRYFMTPKPVEPSKTVSPVVRTTVSSVVKRVQSVVRNNGIKIYGNYCGPNYCGGQRFKGAEGPNCRWGVPPKDSLDSCCKAHDMCCGTAATRSVNCNHAILSCLDTVKCSDARCRISQELMKVTFTGMRNKVCGELFGKKKLADVKVTTTRTEPKIVTPAKVTVVASAAPSSLATPAKVAVVATAAPSSVATPAKAAVVTTIRQSVIDEIIQAKTKSNTKLTTFQTKLISLLKENSDEQVKIETENRNNFNGVSVTLQNEKLRLEAARSHMKKLYDESQLLNNTIHKHYSRLIADTNYLQSLDAMRPGFLKSLSELAVHIQNVKTVVDTKIVKDEYKDEMVRLLSGIHFNTHNISGYVATAFINHYNKYKNMIRIENQDYSQEMNKLTELSNEYKVQQQKTADIEKERARLEELLSKLKDTLANSVSQREEFDVLVKEIMSIFERRGCDPQRR